MLRISTTKGAIGIKTNWATVNMKRSKADMNMKTELPKLDIKRTYPKIKIDQSQCFAEAGLKSPLELSRENSGIAKQAAMKGMASIVDEGNQFKDIHLGGNPIAENAMSNAYDVFLREFNIGFVPKSRPKIDVELGKLDIKYKPGKTDVQVKVNKPEVSVNHGKVDIYMKTWPDIKIQYMGDKLNTRI